jgi:hypothetical protein
MTKTPIEFAEMMQSFPKPVGIQGVQMTERDLKFYYHGWDAALEAITTVAELLPTEDPKPQEVPRAE